MQEDEDTAIREAAKKAEKEYFRTHEVPVTWQCLKDKVGPVPIDNTFGGEFHSVSRSLRLFRHARLTVGGGNPFLPLSCSMVYRSPHPEVVWFAS